MNIQFISDSKDSIAQLKAPTDERMMAFIFAHAGFSTEAHNKLREMEAIDKLDLGRYIAIRDGYPIELTEQERVKMNTSWEHFQRIVQWAVETENTEM